MTTKQEQKREIEISKTLSFFLRHGAKSNNLKMNSDGFVCLKDLLERKEFTGVTLTDIQRIVKNCPKQRFTLIQMGNNNNNSSEEQTKESDWLIRANQGHSMEVEVEMEQLTIDTAPSQAIHGTYTDAWNQIKNTGLSKMARQHIHLAENMPDGITVISGMRSSCQIAIYIDIKRAIKDGFKFYRSANGVILTPGDQDGFLSPKYFIKVIDLKNKKEIQ